MSNVLKFPVPRNDKPATRGHAPYGDGSVWKTYAVAFGLLAAMYVVAYIQFAGREW